MSLEGKNLIGNSLSAEGEFVIEAKEASTGNTLSGSFVEATETEIDSAMQKAASAFKAYSTLSGNQKADFLDAIAEEIMNLGDELVTRACQESGLPQGRIQGERGRTCNQLKMFATLLREGSWVDASIDKAQPNREPLPKADIRLMQQAIGPVVVFGASNFPLAFSTAGGDTASALASGCPVVVKAHEAHPGTSELVAKAILNAATSTNMPEGVFSLLHGRGETVGQALAKHNATKAIGFTGSLRAGKALFDTANSRKEPIPVYAEMGSINPVFLFPEKLENDAEQVAKMYAGSITLGVGQFCTNPGLIVGIKSEGLTNFVQTLGTEIQNIAPTTMLHEGICKTYAAGLENLINQNNVSVVGESNTQPEYNQGKPVVATVDAIEFVNNPQLHEEVFGPFSLVVQCNNETEFADVISVLSGQLTATVMATETELSSKQELINSIVNITGRILFNGVPTGVEVCHSMHHGGPFPSTTDAKFTSVGTGAIKRFTRPVCYQNWPQSLLPEELKNENSTNIWRLIDGQLTKDAI